MQSHNWQFLTLYKYISDPIYINGEDIYKYKYV